MLCWVSILWMLWFGCGFVWVFLCLLLFMLFDLVVFMFFFFPVGLMFMGLLFDSGFNVVADFISGFDVLVFNFVI